MPAFLWSGKDAEGVARNEYVQAENAQTAKAILTGRGWTELELMGDEINEAVRALRPPFPEEWKAGVDKKLNDPNWRVARLRGKKPSFFAKWWQATVKAKCSSLLFVAVLGLGIWIHHWLLIILGTGGILFVLLLSPVILVFYSQTSRNYRRLNEAKIWGRWEEVLECVDRLKQSHRRTRIGVGLVELARNRSKALAALGRLDEAVKEFQKLEIYPDLQHWLYLTHLAGIYDAARQFETGTELRGRAVAEKPEMSALWVDYASSLVRRLSRPAEARAALARAEQLEITAIGKPFICSAYGLIFWREHKAEQAREQLEMALAGFQPFIHRPLIEATLLMTKAHLCAVEVELGNVAKSTTLLTEVEPFLIAHHEEELLRACRGTMVAR